MGHGGGRRGGRRKKIIVLAKDEKRGRGRIRTTAGTPNGIATAELMLLVHLAASQIGKKLKYLF